MFSAKERKLQLHSLSFSIVRMRRLIEESFYLLKASLCLMGIRDQGPSLCIVLFSYLIGTTNHTHVSEMLHTRTEDSPYKDIFIRRYVIKMICVLYISQPSNQDAKNRALKNLICHNHKTQSHELLDGSFDYSCFFYLIHKTEQFSVHIATNVFS